MISIANLEGKTTDRTLKIFFIVKVLRNLETMATAPKAGAPVPKNEEPKQVHVCIE